MDCPALDSLLWRLRHIRRGHEHAHYCSAALVRAVSIVGMVLMTVRDGRRQALLVISAYRAVSLSRTLACPMSLTSLTVFLLAKQIRS